MSEAKNESSDEGVSLERLVMRIEQLERQVLELNRRTAGLQVIGQDYPAPMPEVNLPSDLLDSWAERERNYKLTGKSRRVKLR